VPEQEKEWQVHFECLLPLELVQLVQLASGLLLERV